MFIKDLLDNFPEFSEFVCDRFKWKGRIFSINLIKRVFFTYLAKSCYGLCRCACTLMIFFWIIYIVLFLQFHQLFFGLSNDFYCIDMISYLQFYITRTIRSYVFCHFDMIINKPSPSEQCIINLFWKEKGRPFLYNANISFLFTELFRILTRLKRYGVSGILAYGLLNTAYYLTTFLVVWLVIYLDLNKEKT